MRHWAEAFFLEDHPWESGGQGPKSFNCWGLVRHIQREHYGRDMPLIVVDEGDGEAVAQAVSGFLRGGTWRRTSSPRDGDGVLMRSPSGPHVGVWLDVDGGGVLHCVRGAGVVFSRHDHLRAAGFSRIEYYAPAVKT